MLAFWNILHTTEYMYSEKNRWMKRSEEKQQNNENKKKSITKQEKYSEPIQSELSELCQDWNECKMLNGVVAGFYGIASYIHI